MRRMLALAVASLLAPASGALAQTTAFTYQGRLQSGGAPASGLHDFRFRLYDAATAGTQVGLPVCVDNVGVTNGLFTVQIDFGQQFATTAQRFLEIDVRADTGLNCSNATGFITLGPRQQLTAAPLANHANSAFSLFATSGTNIPAVFVDPVGKVGIGTVTPSKRLSVSGDMELGISSSEYHFLRVGGGNSDGYLYGSFPRFGDGIHIGYNYFADSFGTNQIIHPDGGTSRIGMHYGSLVFATAPAFGGPPIERERIDSAGNVGIGTAVPISKLDVRGDIRLGSSGQYLATAGEENLRIIRGSINGSGIITAGSGFSVQQPDCGEFTVTFDTPFSGPPTIATSVTSGTLCAYTANIVDLSNGSARIFTRRDCDHACVGFNFIAVGPR